MDTKADKLSQARKKLRDYQSRNRKSREETSSPSPSISSIAEINGGGRHSANDSCVSFNHEGKKSPYSSRMRSGSQSSLSSAPTPSNDPPSVTAINGNDSVSLSIEVDEKLNDSTLVSGEVNRLTSELAESERERLRITAQLAQLHAHYTGIYSAYKQLSDSIQSGGTPDNTAFTQLAHLQTAMSVVVTEKTALQGQLRDASELANQRLLQIQSLTEELNEKKSRLSSLEKEAGSAKREIDTLNIAMQRQIEEVDNCRREAANWQARVLRAQHDRNDAQDRLKQCMKEAELAQAELAEARKQLRMKEIYLRQVGAYSSDSAIKEQDIQNLHGENERLKDELQKALAEVQNWKKEAQTAREHYETYGSQLNQNILQLGVKLEEVSNEKLQMELKVQNLEDELEVIRAEEKARNARRGSKENDSLFEMVKLRGELSEMTARIQQAAQVEMELRGEIAQREAIMQEQVDRIQKLENDLGNQYSELLAKKDELTRAQQAASTHDQFTLDAKSLTDQLQSEKATVSRAVAQNRELKDQLIELQDKLIVLSQESMEKESKLLTAEHTIEQLKAEAIKSAHKEPPDDVNNHDETMCSSVDGEEDERDAAVARAEEARVRTQGELARVNMELSDARSELRRVAQENQELRRIMEQNAEDENQNSIHVELGQAVERINALSAENEELRERNRSLVDAAESGETVSAAAGTPSAETVVLSAAVPPENDNNNIVEVTPPVNGDNSHSDPYQDSRLRGFGEPPPIAEKPLAWTELESRFARAMRQNAELVEQNERLEHIIMQLECENDTIGEYVTIYHHQRKLIRDRMRDKDEAVARLSLEKENIQEKLGELQKSVIGLLKRKGLLRQYELAAMKAGKAAAVSKRANKLRSFSHSTVDEVSGNEETVVDGAAQLVPDVHTLGSAAHSSCDSEGSDLESAVEADECTSADVDADDSIGLQRVLNLISELQDPERARSLPPCDPNMHCRECRGKLITL